MAIKYQLLIITAINLHLNSSVPSYFHCTSVHGNWSTDTVFSMCSASCGEGTKTKVVLCNNPRPDNGGNNCTCDYDDATIKSCDGQKKVLEEHCNKKHCPGM